MALETRRLAAVVAAAAALSAAVPVTTAGATIAAGPCRVVSQSTGSEVAIVLEGHYTTKNGGDVTLTCSIIQNGVRVVSVKDPLTGPVAALASDQRLGTAPFRVCYSVTIEDLNPWGPYYSYSDC